MAARTAACIAAGPASVIKHNLQEGERRNLYPVGTPATEIGLAVSESEIEITVLEQVKGLFGKSSVRVRAEVMASAVAAEKPAAKPKANAKPAPAKKKK